MYFQYFLVYQIDIILQVRLNTNTYLSKKFRGGKGMVYKTLVSCFFVL